MKLFFRIIFKMLFILTILIGCASANNVSEKSKAIAEKSYALGFVDVERVLKTSVPGKSAQEQVKEQNDFSI